MQTGGSTHIDIARSEWASLQDCLKSNAPVKVDGHGLKISDVIAVCLYGARAILSDDSKIVNGVQNSVNCLEKHLMLGKTVYGVNTGFGGSADTRTGKHEKLQTALQQLLNVGILLPSDKGQSRTIKTNHAAIALQSHALPVPIVRAMMLIRCNSLMRGHSGVRIPAIQAILILLSKGMTPVVPLRGSISASGDLSPLSYIAGAIEGNPDIFVRLDHGRNSEPSYLPADRALEYAGLRPTRLRAKEGLGIANGTAASCGAACVAIHQAHQVAFLTQVFTAMGTEALLGSADNYHPFISACRPHSGQKEAAANIRALLSGSRLVSTHTSSDSHNASGLAQDRYALRTAPQWMGPQLEDLLLANRQVEVEVNSTTDNPLIDVSEDRIHHGGNFQAASITSAMEKTMTAIQMFGKLLYAQSSELINSTLNKGLPPNLSADDPSLSFTFKGFDINMAAYMSELAYLARPVSSYVQAAEMANQSVNSLALIAARNTLEAIEVISLMQATYLYALCQAIDLRCLHLEFQYAVEPKMLNLARETFGFVVPKDKMSSFSSGSWEVMLKKWTTLSHLDLADRGCTTVKESLGYILESLLPYQTRPASEQQSITFQTIKEYQKRAAVTLSETYDTTRTAFFVKQTSVAYMSTASKIVYEFLRKDLEVPMHRGLIDHPRSNTRGDQRGAGESSSTRKLLGTYASDIYLSIRDGRLYDRVMATLGGAVGERASIPEEGQFLEPTIKALL
ncbi:putative phenylalanine ammonia-lyase [Lophiostoma macrostomum CBS 122681]|uniref:Putative phenylalanine ammonia-lyase n=1 Tax=Lophiostoma macrostomum CBS 122681 TaxID=1314788 RepID=A0A6A6SMH6_9PLEO|nr:putative phenylalanine ammonia-lyase [Lophiostoma macrostomum CBS 122681]